ncbi:DUF4269 domain-containing protein [Halioxenophilus aromaticivorans]|uniref:DUF4269 domain-containing protein n=1 Tax=Halioxenophilus aromaticivorans TaxID=1306992 RepID=A0AAV3U7I6_9ALTE
MTSKIEKAEKAILQSRVKEVFEAYSPNIVSTIFVEFDTDQSDIDVVCEYQQQNAFASLISSSFQNHDSYSLSVYAECVIGQFKVSGFLFEIYGAPIPVTQQLAFRHYQVMQRLARLGGESFKQQIRKLKRSGLKTEPAISEVLALEGDPYNAVLELESWSNAQLEIHIQNRI